MHPLTHRLYRWLLKWYVTVYRPINVLPPTVNRTLTTTHDLGRYVLFSTFFYNDQAKLVLSHIRIYSVAAQTMVVEVY